MGFNTTNHGIDSNLLKYCVRLEIEGSLDRDSLEVLCCVSVGKALNILCCVLVKPKKTGSRTDMTENC